VVDGVVVVEGVVEGVVDGVVVVEGVVVVKLPPPGEKMLKFELSSLSKEARTFPAIAVTADSKVTSNVHESESPLLISNPAPLPVYTLHVKASFPVAWHPSAFTISPKSLSQEPGPDALLTDVMSVFGLVTTHWKESRYTPS
jgi:hypothetical protein